MANAIAKKILTEKRDESWRYIMFLRKCIGNERKAAREAVQKYRETKRQLFKERANFKAIEQALKEID